MFNKLPSLSSVENPVSLALITGATGGLGKAFALECAMRGWDLYLTDVNEEALETLSKSLCRIYHVRVYYQACNLADPDSREIFFKELENYSGLFTCLINVAGLDYEGIFTQQSREHLSTIVRLNVENTLNITHRMLQLRDPILPFRIINVASLAAFYPMPVKATYAASKRFLLDFSLALREELRSSGASVTVLCPAGMPTTQLNMDAIEAQGWMGYITTRDAGKVAATAIDAALAGKPVVIPGTINKVLRIAGSFFPTTWIAALVGIRWRAAQEKRMKPSVS